MASPGGMFALFTYSIGIITVRTLSLLRTLQSLCSLRMWGGIYTLKWKFLRLPRG